MSEKFYVIDTNIPLKNPHFLNTLRNAVVVIPSVVLQEIDNFKKDNELGKNAREFGRILDAIYLTEYKIPETNVQVVMDFRESNPITLKLLGGDTNDNRIIECADYLSSNYDVTLLSEDTLVRVKARGLGLNASTFTSETVGRTSDMIYPGVIESYTDVENIDTLYINKRLSIDYMKEIQVYPHMFMILRDYSSMKSAVVKVSANMDSIDLVVSDIPPVFGIIARNVRQKMALRLLLDPDIPLVTITGKAGTGKTLLTLASSLEMRQENIYDKITIAKPMAAMGKEMGFLPGGIEEKLNPWLQSYFDNAEFLLGPDYETGLTQMNVEINALSYIRGRTLPRQFMVIDEVQNLSKHEVKTIITRAGEGTKIVLMGDPEQIDVPGLDSINNGLVYVINKFKDQEVAGHISLEKGERSLLANIAANIL